MKKITLALAFLLAMVMGSYGQVSYEYGWEPTTDPLGGWTTEQFGFVREVTTPCTGLASARANTYNNAPRSLTSPSLGVSNGGIVTFNFDYKVTTWPGNTVGTPANQVQIIMEWANTSSGPWFTIGNIGEANHAVSTTCAAVSFQFSPTPGDLFVRYRTISINSADVYYYFDNVSLLQGAPPTCVSPSNLMASNVSTLTTTVSWAATTPAPALGYEYFISDVNVSPTAAGTNATSTSVDLTGLFSNTVYYFWVRSMCTDGESVWNGPLSFRTLCEPFGDFVEDFTGTTPGTGIVPSCWTKTLVTTNTSVNVSVIGNNAASAPNAISMTNSSDLTATILLATPVLNAIGANTHRLNFKARGASANFPLIVGTMSDPSDASTFVALETITLGNTYAGYIVNFNTSTTANHIAFRHGQGATFRTIYIDDVRWEPMPTDVPGCVTTAVTVPNACGNFPTTFSWTGVSGANGYNVSISAAPNGLNLLVDNVNIGDVLTYAFTGTINTQYYYTITPYNTFGTAVGCVEGTFTTTEVGCYCVSAPISVDASGITSLTLAGQTFAVTPPATPATPPNFYRNLTGLGATDISQGVNTSMSITLQTGYSYATNVWVDFNNNFVFETSELVFSGPEGSNVNPTIADISFLTPFTAPLGQHRMRLVSTDNLQNPANACYSGSYGMTIDLIVNVLPAPACLPPSGGTASNITFESAVLNWVSSGTLFNVEYVFANEMQGNGVLIEGITATTTTLTGLDAQANYAYYLQTDCGNGSLSAWAGPFLFRTGCPSTGDFIQNFTTDVTITVPECWYALINSTVSSPSVSNNSFNDYITLSTSGNAAAVLYLITPSLTDLPLDTHRIKFKASGPAGTSITVGTMTDPGTESTFSAVQSIQLTSTFTDYAVSFLNSTTDAHVTIRFAGTGTFQTVNIDDVIWETAPDCPAITIVSIIETTATTASVSWSPGGAETAWQYAVALSTVTDPSALTPVDVTPNPNTIIPGLLPSSNYKVWVRAVCAVGFGEWSAAKTFTTACVAVNTFPWTEGFENITPGFNIFPLCWSKENGGYDTANVGSSNYNTPRTGTNYLRNNWSATNEYMWTPEFELTAGVSYDFSFYMQGDGYTGWTVDVFQNSVQNSAGATQLGGTTTASGTGAYVIQPYALVSNTFVPATSGTFYFAVRVNQPSGAPWYIAFDDFRMEPTPTCIAPLPPTATNVTINTATMNWTATTPAPADGYDYYVSSTAVAPTATTVPAGTVAASVTTADLIGLSASTLYRIYVRSICGTDSASSWSDAGTFTTPCDSYNAPFTQNFDTYVPLCWATASAGTVATGPTDTAAGIWNVGGFLNVGDTGAVKVNLWLVNRIGWLITPPMNTTVGNDYSFSFNYGVTVYNQTGPIAMGSDDSVKVVMSIDNGVTWTEINSFTAASNVSNTSQDYIYEFVASTAQAKFALIASDGTVDDSEDYDFFVDNIAFEVNLSNGDFDSNSFVAYPNPVKNVLNVSFNQNISDVAVYNLLGQQVLLMQVNANKGQVDMSSLATGTYLVRVNSENGVKTIKVIKE